MTSDAAQRDDQFRTAAGPATASTLVSGSKFIAYLSPASDEHEAEEKLYLRIRRYPDASHHCWAHRVGRPLAVTERSSDAGEPPGTAGRPILDALRHADLENVVCIVTRYFGGTKLGTGGLVRAYGDTAAAAIGAAVVVTRTVVRVVTIEYDHAQTGFVYRALEEFAVTLRESRYDERAHGVLHVPNSEVGRLRDRIIELAHADISWQEGTLMIL